jgi:hypothetical protein
MKHWIFFIIALALIGCQDVKHPEKPENLISKSKMTDVLTEAYLANAARSVDNRSILQKGIVVDSLLYKKFGIDSLQFAKSNAFYAADVNVYKDIFKQVEARLTAIQDKLDSIQELDKKRKDSVDQKLNGNKPDEKPARDSLI